MKIVVISSLRERTPPPLYGGAERVVSNLTEELVKRGHDVTLFATGDSITKAKLVSVYPRALYRDGVAWTSYADSLTNVAKAVEYAIKNKADIIHSHAVNYSSVFSKISNVPIIHTLHGNIDRAENPPERTRLLKTFRDSLYVSISNAQRALKDLNYIATVYNGVEVDQFAFKNQPKDYLFWMGRITYEKGTKEAILVAKKLKMKLIMAAKLDQESKADVEYYKKEIEPLIDGTQIRYVGEADFEEKNKLLKYAICLLNPIFWDEPFGLVPVEAMACGAPVVTFNRGALSETVVDGKTGFLVEPGNIDAMAEAVKKIGQIDRRACRKHVEDNFTIQKMTNDYEKVYKQVLDRKLK
ncbi:MAG TPA: glycosyltransferase family 4 protein [Patescibacteria group bacterium]|nr:glycosyltransferase family 4 protein [Patescibacteria group bacterium]